jgi:hypothetical protein
LQLLPEPGNHPLHFSHATLVLPHICGICNECVATQVPSELRHFYPPPFSTLRFRLAKNHITICDQLLYEKNRVLCETSRSK